MKSILDLKYSIKTMNLLLKMQIVEGYKMDLYINNEKPYSFWDLDNLKMDIDLLQSINPPIEKNLNELRSSILDIIDIWENDYERLQPYSKDRTQRYNTAHIFFILNKDLLTPLCIDQICKFDNNKIVWGEFEETSIVLKHALYNSFGKIHWHEGVEYGDYELELIYCNDKYNLLSMGELMRSCDSLLGYINSVLPISKPFSHNYSIEQVKYIANELHKMKRIKSKDIFCKVMLGESNEKIDWLCPNSRGEKLDIVSFVLHFCQQTRYDDLAKGVLIPNIEGDMPLTELNRVFDLPGGVVKSSGHYRTSCSNLYQKIFQNLPK